MNPRPRAQPDHERGRWDVTSLLGLPIAVAVFVLAQVLEGGSVRSLWHPTAAIVVFGGTLAAVLISFPIEAIRRTVTASLGTFRARQASTEPVLLHIVAYANKSRRRGLLALDADIERTADPFLRTALALIVDGTNPKTVRQILEIESQTLRDSAELPSDVLETAAGYSPTLGILGAVLGLIHVMESLTDPTGLGAGIAVAFVATVYGVAAANLLLLPLSTKLRARAREESVSREMIIEGVMALQEGLNPHLLEQKLRGYVASEPRVRARGRLVA